MSYTQYSELDELWLPAIPVHWESRKIKYTFAERSEKGYPDEPLLVASQNMGVVPKGVYGNRTVEATKDLQNLKLVRIGNFVISLRSFQGGLEYAYYQGIISPAYTVMIPNEHIKSGYFKYLAKSRLFIELLQMCVTGIREGQNIDYGKLKNHHIPLPPPDEQDQIVRYLDWKVSGLNRLINAKKKQIALLHEQKRAVINAAVTNPAWKTARLKKFLDETKKTVGENSSDYELLSLTKGGVIVRDLSTGKGKFPSDFGTYKIVQPGQIIFCLFDVDETPRTVGLSYNSGMITGAYDVFSINGIEPKFLEYFFISIDDVKGLKPLYTGLRKVVTIDKFLQIQIPQPPIEEQIQIVKLIEAQCSGIDRLIEKINSEISLFHEYRARLIADVVTGKLDVRDVDVPKYEAVEETAESEDVEGEEELDVEAGDV